MRNDRQLVDLICGGIRSGALPETAHVRLSNGEHSEHDCVGCGEVIFAGEIHYELCSQPSSTWDHSMALHVECSALWAVAALTFRTSADDDEHLRQLSDESLSHRWSEGLHDQRSGVVKRLERRALYIQLCLLWHQDQAEFAPAERAASVAGTEPDSRPETIAD